MTVKRSDHTSVEDRAAAVALFAELGQPPLDVIAQAHAHGLLVAAPAGRALELRAGRTAA